MFDYIHLKNGFQIGHVCPVGSVWLPHPEIPIVEEEGKALEIIEALNGSGSLAEALKPEVDKNQLTFNF